MVPKYQYAFRRIFWPSTVELGGFRLLTDRRRVNSQSVKLIYRGNYEAEERLIVEEIVRPGDRVLEGGAGMGLITMTAARIVGHENIVCYEPTPASFTILSENLKNNGFSIEARQKALGLASGTAKFHAQDDLLSSSFFAREGAGKKIDVSVDAITDALTESGANVLILDIEGAEIELLNNAAFPKVEKMIVEVHPQIVGLEKVFITIAKLESCGLYLRKQLSYGKILVFLAK